MANSAPFPDLPSSLLRNARSWTEHGRWRCAVLTGLPHLRTAVDDPGRPPWRTALLLHGQGMAGDVPGPLESLQPGDCFIRYANCPHRLIRNDLANWCEFVLVVDPDLVSHLVDLHIIRLKERWWRGPLGPELLDHVGRCLAPASDPAESLSRLLGLIACLRQRIGQRSDPQVAKARNLLADPHGKSVDVIAHTLGMGETAFRAWFKAATGCTPISFRIQARIALARDLLMDPTVSIAAIAEQLGYPDPFTFSRQFRRVTGLSPDHWRHK